MGQYPYEKFPKRWKDLCRVILSEYQEMRRKELGHKVYGSTRLRADIMTVEDESFRGADPRFSRQNLESFQNGLDLNDEKFKYIDRFVRQALHFCEGTGGRVAMLLNIASLCHPDRHGSFTRRPPSVIYALDDCVCYPNGKPEQATRYTNTHRYCWVIWEPERTSRTEFRWLSTAPFRN